MTTTVLSFIHKFVCRINKEQQMCTTVCFYECAGVNIHAKVVHKVYATKVLHSNDSHFLMNSLVLQ